MSDSWSLPDGLYVLKKCHSVSRCRKLSFPFSPHLAENPDIVEVRCNIEVHEQMPQEEIPEYDYEYDDYEYESSGDYELGSDTHSTDSESNSVQNSISGFKAHFKFSRITGNQVEVHYSFVHDDQLKNSCPKLWFVDILKHYFDEEKGFCPAGIGYFDVSV